MTPAVEDPVSEPDPRSEALLSSLEYNPMTEKCAMDGVMGLGVDTAAQGFSFSVKPVTYRNGYITQAVVNVNLPSRAASDQEQPPLHAARIARYSATMPPVMSGRCGRRPGRRLQPSAAACPLRHESPGQRSIRARQWPMTTGMRSFGSFAITSVRKSEFSPGTGLFAITSTQT